MFYSDRSPIPGTCSACALSYTDGRHTYCDLKTKRVRRTSAMCPEGGGLNTGLLGTPDPSVTSEMQYHGCLVESLYHGE